MSHYYEKNIVDAKDIYTTYLTNVLTPLFYNELRIIYENAMKVELEYIEGEKINCKNVNPGVIILFQILLSDWIKTISDSEVARYKTNSNCADIFDDLIKAVMKSNIIVLTYTTSKKTCKIVKEKLYEKITTLQFIKQCITECIKIFFDHPLLFYHKFPNNELKDNQKTIYYLIKICIKNAIYSCIPMKEVLYEYLNNDYKEPEKPDIRKMIYHDIYDNDEGDIRKILESDNDNLDSLIFDRKKDITSNILEDDFIDYDKIKHDDNHFGILEDDNVVKDNNVVKDDNVIKDDNVVKDDNGVKDDNIVKDDDIVKDDNVIKDDDIVKVDDNVKDNDVTKIDNDKNNKQSEYLKEINKLRDNNINIIKQGGNNDDQNYFGEIYE
jgi:hypothetical protein